MWDGGAVAAELKSVGVTDVVWIPDSFLGKWESAFRADPGLRLVRVCREGEAMAVAAGLLLGGRRPIVMVQCTGFFEAGDAFRNVVHDMKLPLFVVVGVRSYSAHVQGKSKDNCPVFAEPLIQAWRVPYVILDESRGPADLGSAYSQAWSEHRAGAVLLAE